MCARVLLAAMVLLASCVNGQRVLDRAHGFGGKAPARLPQVSEVPVHGFTVALRVTEGDATRKFEGELLAVSEDSVWLHVEGRVVRVLRGHVRQLHLELYRSGAGWYGLWTGLGAASTASHGFFFAASLPAWALAGVPSIVASAVGNDVDVPLEKIPLLSQFARYPAGMPGFAPAPLPAPPTPRPSSLPASQPASAPSAIDEPGLERRQ